ncbi:Nif3-like dinuclear metal center hexameric protein [Patescibacteria group bacterium]|nr:Nif3-like dinuclear metal center hexameric protein [Patescibacteria group bacterium]MBU1613085.1 Nif3-like dinuclear metal center hexameric protein [Patescibacteria group bacterium]
MTVKQIFDLAVKLGIQNDPRGVKGVEKYLDRAKKNHNEAKPEDKEYLDKDRLTNPYSDSRFHTGNLNASVKRVLVGIDIDSSEVLLASQLNERGKKIDLIISHHPLGKSLADLHGVMDMFSEIYHKHGLPIHIAEKITEERIKEVGRGVHPINHFQVIDVANLLGINLMNVHTPADNMVKSYVRKYLDKKEPETLGDLLKVLCDISEYKEAKMRGAGPKIFAGSPNHRVGKYIIEMTGGTSQSNKVYKELSDAGISTVVGMHMRDDAMEKANERHMNVVIAGHISSDSLGMNLFLDELEKKGVEAVPCGGLIRVSRNKKK